MIDRGAWMPHYETIPRSQNVGPGVLHVELGDFWGDLRIR